MDNKSLRPILLIILALVFIRGLIYGLLIPVDRTPDEIHHFKLIKAKQLALEHRYDEAEDRVAAQVELARQNLLYPEIAGTRSLADVQGANLPAPPSSRQVYYLSTAWLLRMLSLADVRNELFVIRGFSLVIGIIVVLFSFLVAQELFPENPFVIIGVPTLIAFIPQFSAMNGSINNDKLAELFAALFFFFIVKIFKYGITWGYSLAVVSSMVLAWLGKRSAFFVIPVFILFLFIYWWKSSLGIRMHGILAGILAGLLLGGYLLLKMSPAFEVLINKHLLWLPAYKVEYLLFRPEIFSLKALKHYLKFFIVFYWSFWGVFGYMTIHLHHFWYMLVAFGQLLSIGGLGWLIVKSKRNTSMVARWQAKTLYLFAASILLAIAIPFLRSCVLRIDRPLILTQGRYLFPLLIPVSVLTVFGLAVLIPPRYHRFATIAGILGLFVLDSVCLSNYLLLNFHSISIF